MLDLALKNILRQKTRTILTIIGITIGIAAIITLGSISEGLTQTINSDLEFLSGFITVTSKDASTFFVGYLGSEITQDEANELLDVSGVKDVVPFNLATGPIIPFHGPEYIVYGFDPDKSEYFEGKDVDLESGRRLEPSDEFVAVIGFNYAETRHITLSDFIELEDEEFEVVGILEKTESDTDDIVFLPLDTMNDVYDFDTYRAVYVIPDDVSKMDSIAETINEEFTDLSARTTADIAKQASGIINNVRFFTVGIAAISAIVGGLGVMNTMIMSVLERRQEIGILKALGATNKFVMKLILIESSLISLVGGIFGVMVGFVSTFLMKTVSQGTAIAIITPNLIIYSLIFATSLGVIGGLYPSKKAADLSPIEALRYE